jgi:hypothetical protein
MRFFAGIYLMLTVWVVSIKFLICDSLREPSEYGIFLLVNFNIFIRFSYNLSSNVESIETVSYFIRQRNRFEDAPLTHLSRT